jgi:type II secretory pathway component GspD/PulD (secretin)
MARGARIGGALVGLGLLALAPGCGEITAKSEFEVANANSRMRQGAYDYQSRDAVRAGAAQISDSFFVAPVDTRVRAADLLPPRLQAVDAVSIVSREPLTLAEIAARLTRVTGVPHVVALGATGTRAFLEDDGSVETRLDGNTTQRAASANISGGAGSSAAGTRRIRPNLTGSLSEVLDAISDSFDVEWSVGDDRVIFRDFVTRQYQLSSLQTDSEIWSEVTGTLSGLVTSGTQITIGQTTGIITVTALLADHSRIEEYLSTMNKSLGQQIAFEVTVLNMNLTEQEGFNVNIDQIGFNLDGSPSIEGGFRGVGSIGEGAGAIGSANVSIVGENFNVPLAVQALSTRNEVMVENRAGATTTNFQTVPIEVVQDDAYVASIETLRDSNGDVTGQSVTPGTVTTGFTMEFTPRILNTREILVRYSLELSDVIQIENFTGTDADTGATLVQLPEVSRVNLEQQVILRNGQTLVLFGFERQRAAIDRQGIGDPSFFGLGGARGAQSERIASIIFITPRLLSRISGGG